jgi:hypothetical protein
MIARDVYYSIDDYVNIEFWFDPENRPIERDIFLVGSFNNWLPTADWQMYYDERNRLYKLRQSLRRGRHNYLYATGKLHPEMRVAVGLDTEELEGNTRGNSQTFIALIYYKEMGFGGFDALVGVAVANALGNIKR